MVYLFLAFHAFALKALAIVFLDIRQFTYGTRAPSRINEHCRFPYDSLSGLAGLIAPSSKQILS